MTKILKFIVLVRDRPFVFFSVAFPFLLFLLAFGTGLLGILYHFWLKPNSMSDQVDALVNLIFIPIAPVFFGVMIPFGEAYMYSVFKLLRIRFLGFKERKLANSLAGWAERSLLQEET